MGSRRISLEVYQGPWAPDDKDANFKEEVAHYSRVDPMTTLDRMSHNLGIPVGALVRYILVKWAASGSEGLMEIGPRVVRQMEGMLNKAEAAGTNEARLDAYHALAQIISWLKVPLDSPQRPIAQGKG
ncbi:MAG: DUF6027 family protein [Chloroflexi bacterium]|nr:DUF6027 family protein [Chloroflexota bacterium]MCZ6867649.1 DUF6027 family protein [Chloroflexota bacterium]